MSDRRLISSFMASSLIHLALIPAAALIMRIKPMKPSMVPIELVEVPRLEEPKKVEVPPPPPPPKPKNINAPKLLSKPALETKFLPPPASTKEKVKETAVVGGSDLEGGGGGQRRFGTWHQGRRHRQFGRGAFECRRPVGGYQVKPRYPESARRAAVQGVTTLRVRVLENGRVGDVLVEQSAGFRDLDMAINKVNRALPNHGAVVELINCYHNLLRRFAEV